MPGFGVSIEDVRIRRADLPPENTQAILSRMQSERQRVAAQARAEGAEASAKIRADAERERTVLLAEARATADRLRGEGEAGAIAIYAKAFSQDPWFFGIWRTLQGYRDAFATGAARLVMTPDNAYLHYLQAAPDPTRPVTRTQPPATFDGRIAARCIAVRQWPGHMRPSPPGTLTMRLYSLRHRPRRPARRFHSACRAARAGDCRLRRPTPARAPDSFADLAAKLLPAVVNVSSSQTGDRAQRRPGRRPGRRCRCSRPARRSSSSSRTS